MSSERMVSLSEEANLLLRVVMDESIEHHLLNRQALSYRLTTKKGTIETALCYFAACLAVETQNAGAVSLLPRKLEAFRALYERRNVPLPHLDQP